SKQTTNSLDCHKQRTIVTMSTTIQRLFIRIYIQFSMFLVFCLSFSMISAYLFLLLKFYSPFAGWPVLLSLSSLGQLKSRAHALYHLYSRQWIVRFHPVLV